MTDFDASDRLHVIAIDGPASSGKSTLARLLAQRLGGFGLSTGQLYRWLGLLSLEQGRDIPVWQPSDFRAVERGHTLSFDYAGRTAPDALESREVAMAASRISQNEALREALIAVQRNVAHRPLIADGRDIGTRIFPDAGTKFFVTASPDVRALRRARQLGDTSATQIAAIREELIRRDKIDSERAVAPLRAAPDALIIDTSDATADQVVDRMVELLPFA